MDWGLLASSKEIGTFKDNLRAPVHRWFKYPAGYSYRLVNQIASGLGLRPTDVILDPFVGSGTTCLAAKTLGINSVGIEAHPFVQPIAEVKCFSDYDPGELDAVTSEAIGRDFGADHDLDEFPELIRKCYSDANLAKLKAIRDGVSRYHEPYAALLKLALTDTLRESSSAGTGWSYIVPKNEYHGKNEKDAAAVFRRTVDKFKTDLVKTLPYAGDAHGDTACGRA